MSCARLVPHPKLTPPRSAERPFKRGAVTLGPLRLGAIATASILLCNAASAQTAPARAAAPASAASGAAEQPVSLQAERISGQPDIEAVAEGAVELRRGNVVIRADRLTYRSAEDLARATGKVRLDRDGDHFSGSEMQLQMQRFEGYVLNPEYFFARTQAGGRAARLEMLSPDRSRLVQADYTSCPRDGGGAPAWLLTSERVTLDFEANEGVAEGAALRFFGVPILAAPVLTFPLTDARKSGWLPPSLNLDNRSGIEVGVPYYWNIAPQRDATLTPTFRSRRGLGLDSEFRYLEPRYRGTTQLNLMPDDRVAQRSRYSLRALHSGLAPGDVNYRAEVSRVSDDSYWKDFPRDTATLSPRLLPQDLQAERSFDRDAVSWSLYGRMQHWQVLQDALAPIESPYQRSPQLGVSGRARLGGGIDASLQTEFNRFTLPGGAGATRLEGQRWHGLATVERRFEFGGAWLTPRLALNTASYRTEQPMADGRRHASRAIPSLSVDSGLSFERDAQWFGRPLRQTLEPRLLYLNTPYRAQNTLPVFDTWGKDFNIVSLFSDNAFSGVDRVSDLHQLTLGATTRLLDPDSGVEAVRLGLGQRVLFRDSRVTANPDGSPDGATLEQRVSDLLFFGSSKLGRLWTLDGALQYSPESRRATRSILGARYSPGPFRTASLRYRLTRDVSEQVEFGWQWPVYGPASDGCKPPMPAAPASTASAGSTTAGARAVSPTRWWAWSSIRAAGSPGWWPSACPPAAPKPPRGCCCNWSWSACRAWAPTRCRS